MEFENYDYNYRGMSGGFVDQTNSYPPILDAESLQARARGERLGDVGYDCTPQPSPAYGPHCGHDGCYDYRVHHPRYSPPTENYQSPTMDQLKQYPYEDPGCDISGLGLDKENCEDHSSPDMQRFLPVTSSPEMQLPLSPTYWMQYSDDEFSQNMNTPSQTFPRAPYGELQAGSGTMQSNNHFFLSPRTVEDNNTNLGYQPHGPLDLDHDISRPSTAICDTSGKTPTKQENYNTAITEEKDIPTLESPIDQKNKSPETRRTGPHTPTSRRHKCQARGCNLQFKRRAEMDRHKESVHQPSSPGHLCPIPGCNRGVPDNGFSRKDNLRQHLKLKHEIKFPKGRRSRRT